jgi:hypothetical protein
MEGQAVSRHSDWVADGTKDASLSDVLIDSQQCSATAYMAYMSSPLHRDQYTGVTHDDVTSAEVSDQIDLGYTQPYLKMLVELRSRKLLTTRINVSRLLSHS